MNLLAGVRREVLKICNTSLRVKDLLTTEYDKNGARNQSNKSVCCIGDREAGVFFIDGVNQLLYRDERRNRDHIFRHELLNLEITQLAVRLGWQHRDALCLDCSSVERWSEKICHISGHHHSNDHRCKNVDSRSRFKHYDDQRVGQSTV